jgi:pyruvate/2-oxoglutarate/acetoin dehydrogenase E1 component
LCSAASEIAAIAADKAFSDLRAPVRRVTAPNVPVPFSPPMEDFVLPKADRIAAAVHQVLDY